MQKGSLVVPVRDIAKDLAAMKRDGYDVTCEPYIPTDETPCTVKSIDALDIQLEEVYLVTHTLGATIGFRPQMWREVQPPVNVQAWIEDIEFQEIK